MRNTVAVLFACLFPLYGCSDGDQENNFNEQEPVITFPSGGNLGNPRNLISGNIYSFARNKELNYYSISVDSGDTIFIHAVPDEDISIDDRRSCALAEGMYGDFVGIRNIEDNYGYCSYDFSQKFDEAGIKTIKVGYASATGGYLLVVKTSDELLNSPLTANGSGGSPVAPHFVDLNGPNDISDNPLQNYYAYNALAGETISIAAELGNITTTYRRGCSLNDSYYNTRSYGVSVDFGNVSCSDSYVHTFSEAGIHSIRIKPVDRSRGEFYISSNSGVDPVSRMSKMKP